MSRRTNLLIFDDYVPRNRTLSNPVYTSTEFDHALAMFDQIAIQVIVDNVTRSGMTAGLSLQLQTSGNGRHYAPLGGSPEVNIPGTPGLVTTATNVAAGSYPSSIYSGGALLGFVRFAIYFAEATTSAHVKVYVTQRDQAK